MAALPFGPASEGYQNAAGFLLIARVWTLGNKIDFRVLLHNRACIRSLVQ